MSERAPQTTSPEIENFEIFQVISDLNQTRSLVEIKDYIKKGHLGEIQDEEGRQFVCSRQWKGEQGTEYNGMYSAKDESFSVAKYFGEGITSSERLVVRPIVDGPKAYTVTWDASKDIMDQKHLNKAKRANELDLMAPARAKAIGIAQDHTNSRLEALLPELTQSIQKRGRIARALGRRSSKAT